MKDTQFYGDNGGNMTDLIDKYLGEAKMNLTNLALATMIKKNYGKTITIDKLSHELSVANIHPDDHMPDVEDALNRIGVKIIPSWSTKKTKVGDKSKRKSIKKAGKYGMTV